MDSQIAKASREFSAAQLRMSILIGYYIPDRHISLSKVVYECREKCNRGECFACRQDLRPNYKKMAAETLTKVAAKANIGKESDENLLKFIDDCGEYGDERESYFACRQKFSVN